MLTRIYGVAFESKEELEHHLAMLAEAEKRDHKVLGPKLDLFMFHLTSRARLIGCLREWF